MKRGIIIVRSNEVDPDPRVEKTARWLMDTYKIFILCWNRNMKSSSNENTHFAEIQRFEHGAKYGSGIKNLFGLIAFNFWVFKKLIRSRKSYSYIHACDLDTIIPCLIVGKLYSKKVIYDIFDYFADSRGLRGQSGAIVRGVENLCIRGSDALIIVDKSRYNQINTELPLNHAVVYNVPDLIESENTEVVVDNVISYVGVLQDHRFIKELCEVMAVVPNWKLKIAGFGALEDFVISQSQKNKNIEFFGRLSYDEAMKINESSKVMLAIYDPKLPNHKYASPNKLFESLALGKVLIAAANTSVDTVVNETEVGYVFNYDNKLEFVDILKTIQELTHLELEALSKRAKRYSIDQFSPFAQKRTLLSVYEKLC